MNSEPYSASMLRPFAALALLALLAAPTVHAAADRDEAQDEAAMYIDALDSNLAAQQQNILDEMRPKGSYAELEQDALEEVLDDLDRMQQIVGDTKDVSHLTPEQRAELLTLQSNVNTILTQARADSRIKCRRFKVVGTRLRKTTVCRTVRDWDLIQQASSQEIMTRLRGSREQEPM